MHSRDVANKTFLNLSALFIINPSSGGSRALGHLQKIQEAAATIDSHSVISKSEAHFRSLIANADNNITSIIITGGDSSLRIAAEEIYHRKKKQGLCVIPMGSSDDIARHIGIRSLDDTMAALRKEPVFISLPFISAGAKRKCFLGAASFGLGASVNERVLHMKTKSRIWQRLQTVAGAWSIYTSLRSKQIPVQAQVNQTHKEQFNNLLFSQISSWSAGRSFTGEASMQQDFLEASFMKKCGFARIARIMLSQNDEVFENEKNFIKLKSTRFDVSFEESQAVQLDGDIWQDQGSPVKAVKFGLWKEPRALRLYSIKNP